MQERSRILTILRYLYDQTDINHRVSSRDIKRMLEQNGIEAPVSRTIDSDIDQMVAAGHDIEKYHINGGSMYYNIASREYDTVELKLLIDSIAASRCISIERSKRMISRLIEKACISDRAQVGDTLNQVRSIKNAAGGALYIADALFQAVIDKQKIEFRMNESQTPEDSAPPRKRNPKYIVSPYATLLVGGHYYLIGYDEKSGCIITPKMEHIRKVKNSYGEFTPPPKGFDIGYYYSYIEKGCDSEEIEITIEFENHLLGNIGDRFGADFECIPVTDHTSLATVKASIGSALFGWLCQYAGEIRLTGPTRVVSQYKKHLKLATQKLKRE